MRPMCSLAQVDDIPEYIKIALGTTPGMAGERRRACRNEVFIIISYKAAVVPEYLDKEQVILLPQLPYSPDLAPCDFFIPRIKKELKGKVLIMSKI